MFCVLFHKLYYLQKYSLLVVLTYTGIDFMRDCICFSLSEINASWFSEPFCSLALASDLRRHFNPSELTCVAPWQQHDSQVNSKGIEMPSELTGELCH